MRIETIGNATLYLGDCRDILPTLPKVDSAGRDRAARPCRRRAGGRLMRNMSFALTTPQIMEGTKTVTRRVGWLRLKPGDQLRPVRKCMGLRPGEKLDVLRDPLIVVSVRREPLRAMTDDVEYGFRECELEGFGAHPDYRWPSAFVAMFCATHKGCTPETTVTRIEFAYHQDDGRLHG